MSQTELEHVLETGGSVEADRWWEGTWSAPLAPYAILMEAFLQRRLTGTEFETVLYAFASVDDRLPDGPCALVIDELIAVADSYTPEEHLRDGPDDIDEETFREQTRELLERLRRECGTVTWFGTATPT